RTSSAAAEARVGRLMPRLRPFFALAVLAALGPLTAADAAPTPATLRILTNHLGYEAHGSKKFVVQVDQELTSPSFQVVDEQWRVLLAGGPGKFEKVDNWRRWRFWRGYFSTLEKPGTDRIRVAG